jgi:A/G-specific adenine glycosylase
MQLSTEAVVRFQQHIWNYYHKYGRPFPWRDTNDPYKILVSELMLQQTQTERVLKKYQPFLERFPGYAELATAALAEVLSLWQGLGYNRRVMLYHFFDSKDGVHDSEVLDVVTQVLDASDPRQWYYALMD